MLPNWSKKLKFPATYANNTPSYKRTVATQKQTVQKNQKKTLA